MSPGLVNDADLSGGLGVARDVTNLDLVKGGGIEMGQETPPTLLHEVALDDGLR
jgi:hypothetical protein